MRGDNIVDERENGEEGEGALCWRPRKERRERISLGFFRGLLEINPKQLR